jgi:LuxR family maltose regulon positive regulatory protein
MLEELQRANLFIVPLDNERRWYRYHHLWADLLRQRLQQRAASPTGDTQQSVNELHIRASQWFEDNGLEIEAFQHAASANDFERAERLIEGDGVPVHFRGAGTPIRNWLESLPRATLNARPSLWVTYASVLLMTGQPAAVEEKLIAAETALQGTQGQGAEPHDEIRDLVGRIASLRATLAVMQQDAETIIAQSRRALEYLHPNNLPLRTATTWTLGYAYQVQGDRAAASQAYSQVISISKSFGPSIYTTAAILCLGQVQETENHLHLAAESYRQVLILAGDPPEGIAGEAHLGLVRIYYQWNDLAAAEHHGQQCVQLLRQIDNVNTAAALGVWLARLKLAQGDLTGAIEHTAEAEALVRQHGLLFRMPDVVAAQVLILLRQRDLAEAAHLAQTQDLPLSHARVHLAQGDTSAAIALLEPFGHAAEAKGWADEQLQVMVLQAVAYHAHGEKSKAVQLLDDALRLAEPEGFIRIFVDEGTPMTTLLREAAKRGTAPTYVRQLRAALRETWEFGEVRMLREVTGSTPVTQLLIEPLSERELDVLRLLRTELDGPGVARGLMVSVNTMRTHTKNIYTKLGVTSRRAAVRRAEELHLL